MAFGQRGWLAEAASAVARQHRRLRQVMAISHALLLMRARRVVPDHLPMVADATLARSEHIAV